MRSLYTTAVWFLRGLGQTSVLTLPSRSDMYPWAAEGQLSLPLKPVR